MDIETIIAKMDEQVTDVQKVAEPYGWKIVQCKLLKLI